MRKRSFFPAAPSRAPGRPVMRSKIFFRPISNRLSAKQRAIVFMEAPTSSVPDVPPFATAVDQLQKFIGNHGVLHRPVWVFREDVASVKWRIWVRSPLPLQNSARSEALYEVARTRGLGVALEVLCLLEFEPCCFVWWPRDAEEASYAMLSGLKLSIPHPLLAADPVGNAVVWWYRRWREGRCSFPSYVARVPNREG